MPNDDHRRYLTHILNQFSKCRQILNYTIVMGAKVKLGHFTRYDVETFLKVTLIFWKTFQESKDQALYLDAHVLDAQRWRHDVRGCRCRFLVQYDHDQSEVQIHL